jgi:hypothetical protein
MRFCTHTHNPRNRNINHIVTQLNNLLKDDQSIKDIFKDTKFISTKRQTRILFPSKKSTCFIYQNLNARQYMMSDHRLCDVTVGDVILSVLLQPLDVYKHTTIFKWKHYLKVTYKMLAVFIML